MFDLAGTSKHILQARIVVLLATILNTGFFVQSPAVACDNFQTSVETEEFEQSRWFRFDEKKNMVHLCMIIKRLKAGTDPFSVQPFLKQENSLGTDPGVELEAEELSLDVDECDIVCWWFKKPASLDLSELYEYTDFLDGTGNRFDYIWRDDKIEGFNSNFASPRGTSQTLPWPLFNRITEALPAQIEVETTFDLSDALPGWGVSAIDPPLNTPFILNPGDLGVGSITIQKPATLQEGVSIIRAQLRATATNELVNTVVLDFSIDGTDAIINSTSATRVDGTNVLFEVTAEDLHSGVSDNIEVYYSVNGGPFESAFLERFAFPEDVSVFSAPSSCSTCKDPTTSFRTIGPFDPDVSIDYYFTVPDESGNVVTTPIAQLVFSVIDIPALSERGLIFLAMLLAAVGVARVWRVVR